MTATIRTESTDTYRQVLRCVVDVIVSDICVKKQRNQSTWFLFEMLAEVREMQYFCNVIE